MASAAAPPPRPRYAVVGHPVAHSLSPIIHRAFSAQTGDDVDYGRIEAPLDGFAAAATAFVDGGGRGFNVTVPFKQEAFALCGARVSDRARQARAVNVVASRDDGLHGDNTDGVGLVADLARLADETGFALVGARVLVVGAGGSARGIVGPLVDAGIASLAIANRDVRRARSLVDEAVPGATALAFDELDPLRVDLVVNATSASLAGASLPLPSALLANARLAYDLMYGARPTRFLADARAAGTAATADGLGMLVEQAAESFAIWRGVRPEATPVLALLRASLAS